MDWLAELRARDPTLADDVQAMLEKYRAVNEAGFLEESLSALPADLARDPAPRFEATINCLVVDAYHGAATSNFPHALARAREAAALHEAHGRTNSDT